MRLHRAIGAFAILALAGCTTPIPLNTVQFSGTVKVSTDLNAKVNVLSGAIRGVSSSALVPEGSLFVPISIGPFPEQQFHADDQRAFGEALRSELLRLKLFRSAVTTDTGNPPDVTVNLLFAQTFHNYALYFYVLDVVMEVQGGPKPFLKQYRVVSSEKNSEWQRMDEKAKAAKLLLQKLIPDIEAYVATMQHKSAAPTPQ